VLVGGVGKGRVRQVDKIIREYMAQIGSVGGRTKGPSKRRAKEHYEKIRQVQLERWRRYRKERGLTKPGD
jgi:hypothetical protein